jgi:hypothetical protein
MLPGKIKALTVDGRKNLMVFHMVGDWLMLRKAYACSMLRCWGYPIPAINDLGSWVRVELR